MRAACSPSGNRAAYSAERLRHQAPQPDAPQFLQALVGGLRVVGAQSQKDMAALREVGLRLAADLGAQFTSSAQVASARMGPGGRGLVGCSGGKGRALIVPACFSSGVRPVFGLHNGTE